jgi:two-component system, NtrC family, response regulator GlrR
MAIEEKQAVKRSLKKKLALNRILGRSKAVGTLRQQIENIASCDVSVLIIGECGTGKELAARAIHYLSGRAGNPYVPVNCGAIPENLFENELFGHRKGAYTDAAVNQEGLVREAQEGTLFLDEIGVITSYIQVKLLRLLQDKEYKPLGDPKPRLADIRIIAATNRELNKMVKDGIFREDLFFRLNIVSLNIPPLRQRKEDIPILVNHFLEQYSCDYRKERKELTDEAMESLMAYSWPGNIRELENKIQHAIVMAEGDTIAASDLHLPVAGIPSRTSVTGMESFKEAKRRVVEDFEKNYLTLLLAEFNGDVVSAAQKAGKSRTALWNLLSKYRLHPSQFGPVIK